MKRIVFGIALACLALGAYIGIPPPRDAHAQIITGARLCDKVAAFPNLGTTATVQAIAGAAGTNIYVCGIVATASTATAGVNINLTEGTGSNCATGTASIGSAFLTTPTAAPTTPNAQFFGAPGSRVTATAGDALCVTQSSAANATTSSGLIFYTQGP